MKRVVEWFYPDPARPLTQVWLASLWMGLVASWPLWKRLLSLPELGDTRGLVFIIAFAGMVVAATGAVLSLFAWPRLVKAVLALLIAASAALAYFIDGYGIVFDPTMVVNMLQTDVRETRDLLNFRLLFTVLVLGIAPAIWIVVQPRAPAQRFVLRTAGNLASFTIGLIILVALAMVVFADLSSTMRNHKALRYMITPLNAVYSVSTVAVRSRAAPSGPPQQLGADARLLARQPGTKPPLLLLVVGETARSMNFSLNGYARQTNPELTKLPVISFSDVTSCGTATAASLPCMFSHLGRSAFVDLKGSQENLLDVLQRAGLAVLWLDNQSGCKGLCDRVPNSRTSQLPKGAEPLPTTLCGKDEFGNPECFDEALLHELDKRVAELDPARLKKGLVLVMHQMGSHGPAYYKRAPSDLKLFKPECQSNALQQCKRAEVVNAYDNTIATTDRLLARSIGWLQTQADRFEPGMLYISDHGESLGENGLYLHGLPYAMAPREQTQVPMILWVPTDGVLARSLKPGCLGSLRDKPASHDNLFHTVMGWVGATADVYRPAQDLLAACR